jgi:hypothetical protein
MNVLNRRRFLAIAAASCASLKGLAQETPYDTALALHPEMPLCAIPADFAGLSYELLELADPGCFSPHNHELIERFRFISPRGVLRLGGNTSDFSYWVSDLQSPIPTRRPAHAFGIPPMEDKPYPLTPAAIERLRGFLDATGWTCIYGINLATNVPAVAVEEAAAVTNILGDKLQYLQIGNEADRYAINKRRDPATWGPVAYFKEWLTFARPIAAHVPHVRLGLPDMAAKSDWFAEVVSGLSNDPLRSRVAMLTYHYYEDGPATNPNMNIPNLLNSNTGVIEDADVVRGAADDLQKPWRMTEGNTCWSGGKPGVSDVFASALWAADYALLHASLGCAGINLHGGNGKAVAYSPTGKLPGDDLPGDDLLRMAHSSFADHPHPYYTPIARIGESYVAQPLAYGMRFASQFAGLRMIAIDWDPGPVNATAYGALTPDGRKIVAVINKDSTRSLKVDVRGYTAELSLAASSLESRSAEVGKPPAGQPMGLVPAGSAMLFREL